MREARQNNPHFIQVYPHNSVAAKQWPVWYLTAMDPCPLSTRLISEHRHAPLLFPVPTTTTTPSLPTNPTMFWADHVWDGFGMLYVLSGPRMGWVWDAVKMKHSPLTTPCSSLPVPEMHTVTIWIWGPREGGTYRISQVQINNASETDPAEQELQLVIVYLKNLATTTVVNLRQCLQLGQAGGASSPVKSRTRSFTASKQSTRQAKQSSRQELKIRPMAQAGWSWKQAVIHWTAVEIKHCID
jgi:hypothetical protein